MITTIKFRINGHDWAYRGESQDFVDMIETLADRKYSDWYYSDATVSDATVYFIEDDDDGIANDVRGYPMDPEDASNLRHLVATTAPSTRQETAAEDPYPAMFWLGEEGECC